jgi:hypothetical protein
VAREFRESTQFSVSLSSTARERRCRQMAARAKARRELLNKVAPSSQATLEADRAEAARKRAEAAALKRAEAAPRTEAALLLPPSGDTPAPAHGITVCRRLRGVDVTFPPGTALGVVLRDETISAPGGGGGSPRVVIASIGDGGQAAASGAVAADQIVLNVDGVSVEHVDAQSVSLRIRRAREDARELTVRLMERPAFMDELRRRAPPPRPPSAPSAPSSGAVPAPSSEQRKPARGGRLDAVAARSDDAHPAAARWAAAPAARPAMPSSTGFRIDLSGVRPNEVSAGQPVAVAYTPTPKAAEEAAERAAEMALDPAAMRRGVDRVMGMRPPRTHAALPHARRDCSSRHRSTVSQAWSGRMSCSMRCRRRFIA